MSDHSFPWGTTFPFDITVTLNGSAVNLTGKTLLLKAKYRKTDADDDAVISMSTGSGIEVTNAAGGVARATITPAMTDDLPAGRTTRLHYDVRLIDGSNPYVLVSGTLTVEPVVVRATS